MIYEVVSPTNRNHPVRILSPTYRSYSLAATRHYLGKGALKFMYWSLQIV